MIEFELPYEPGHTTDTTNSISLGDVYQATFATNALLLPKVCEDCGHTYHLGLHPDNGCATGVVDDVHST